MNSIYQDQTIRTTALINHERENPGTIIQPDGIHLTQKGAEMITREILKKIQDRNEDMEDEDEVQDEENLAKALIKVPSEVAKHIVGRGGHNIKKLTDNYNIKVTSLKDTSRNLDMELIGSTLDTASAVNEINTTIEKYSAQIKTNAENKEKYKDTVCRNYLRSGRCKYGGNCWYKHTDNNQTYQEHNSRERSRDRRRSRSTSTREPDRSRGRRNLNPQRDRREVLERDDVKPDHREENTKYTRERSRIRNRDKSRRRDERREDRSKSRDHPKKEDKSYRRHRSRSSDHSRKEDRPYRSYQSSRDRDWTLSDDDRE